MNTLSPAIALVASPPLPSAAEGAPYSPKAVSVIDGRRMPEAMAAISSDGSRPSVGRDDRRVRVFGRSGVPWRGRRLSRFGAPKGPPSTSNRTVIGIPLQVVGAPGVTPMRNTPRPA